MKAMVNNKYGSTDVLKLKEAKIPTLEDKEILVKVHVVSVNSWSGTS